MLVSNLQRVDRDFRAARSAAYDTYWKQRDCRLIPEDIFRKSNSVYLEVGAGTGAFFSEMARLYPEKYFVAVERDKMRGKRLAKRTKQTQLNNFLGLRGNIIPPLICEIPDATIERIYILYPCPWPKTSQRKHRWYLHPVMPHLLRILKPGGLILWASDQQFYIEEARFTCETHYQMSRVYCGPLAPNTYNDLAQFPGGRSKFERSFLAAQHCCHELIVSKS
jgi:tRNA G46 methylase TrmB